MTGSVVTDLEAEEIRTLTTGGFPRRWEVTQLLPVTARLRIRRKRLRIRRKTSSVRIYPDADVTLHLCRHVFDFGKEARTQRFKFPQRIVPLWFLSK